MSIMVICKILILKLQAETMAVSLQTQLKQMKEFQAKTADEASQLTEQLTVAQKAREQLEAQLETANKAQTRYCYLLSTFLLDCHIKMENM